ncbi:hypothetical protein [uncultured Boseongicola sp.]|jgi:hypothetical protein|uniref:hypothetical protein n=1 Tax=uncultured Boseongicola sp. TaxID=1648499 RepID=UPI002603F9FC|nr:hypothetical protein [uncultured Boseongicola sp.]
MHDTIDTDVLANLPEVTPKVGCLTLDTVAGIIDLVASRSGQLPEFITNTRLEAKT